LPSKVLVPLSSPPFSLSAKSQSVSLSASQPAGQQPSPDSQAVMGGKKHSAVQFAAEPVSRSSVQGSSSSQEVGQSPSQVSP